MPAHVLCCDTANNSQSVYMAVPFMSLEILLHYSGSFEKLPASVTLFISAFLSQQN